MAWSKTARNLLATLALAFVYVALWIGPEADLPHAVLDCTERAGGAQTLSDMNACTDAQVGEFRYCPCYRPSNPLAFPYYNLIIPLVFAILGYFLPTGTWSTKAILLSTSIVVGGIVVAQFRDIEAEGIPFWYLYVVQLAVSANLVLALFAFGSRFVRVRSGAA